MFDVIPSDLMMKILSRISSENLIYVKCVCKAWRRMIEDPYFIKIHNKYQNNECLNDNGYLVAVNQENKVCLSPLDFRKTDIELPYPLIDFDKYIASCNGLILHWYGLDESKKLLSIWNPLTNELHKLPKIPEFLEEDTDVDFGYDSVSDDYKVLAFILWDDSGSHLWIYSLKLDSWKQVENIRCGILKPRSRVRLNGALHLVAIKQDLGMELEFSILAFDLETENRRFYKIPERVESELGMELEFDLVELDGCLSISHYKEDDCLEVWSMKEYGIESSWQKLFSIDESLLDINDRYAMILNYSASTKSYLIVEEAFDDVFKSKLCWFDLHSNTFDDSACTFLQNKIVVSTHLFIPSLVRIKVKEA